MYVARRNRTDREFWLKWRTEFADNDRIERRLERDGNLIG